MGDIEHDSKSITVEDGQSIVEACEQLGVPFACYTGYCGICQIRIIKGKDNLSELTEAEESIGMNNSRRLACQCRIKSGKVVIDF